MSGLLDVTHGNCSSKAGTYFREFISRTRLSQEMFSSLPLCRVPKTSFWNTGTKQGQAIRGDVEAQHPTPPLTENTTPLPGAGISQLEGWHLPCVTQCIFTIPVNKCTMHGKEERVRVHQSPQPPLGTSAGLPPLTSLYSPRAMPKSVLNGLGQGASTILCSTA